MSFTYALLRDEAESKKRLRPAEEQGMPTSRQCAMAEDDVKSVRGRKWFKNLRLKAEGGLKGFQLMQKTGKGLLSVGVVCALVGSNALSTTGAAEGPGGKEYINSIGMRLVRIEAGEFLMGFEGDKLGADLFQTKGELPRGDSFTFGDYDERPRHKVRISRDFYMGVCEVTNAQYELFDREHRRLRGKLGLSKGDDEAVVFVNWYDATAFCRWLSDKEHLTYRLPTEAEWEYACRAGSETIFHTGRSLPEAFQSSVRRSWYPDPRTTEEIDDPKWVDRKETRAPILTVATTPPNRWGLYDMHGNVEEWCHDWYGPYRAGVQVDPLGAAEGDFRVTRGGSHSTELYYLRSANRMGMLPEDRNWYIGFRVVLGEMPGIVRLPQAKKQMHKKGVSRTIGRNVANAPDPNKPYFKGPRRYVKIPADSNGPLFPNHNHDPGIVECPNGDLLAIWYTCVEEDGRELAVAASRLRYGAEQWEGAWSFWDAPDRNDHCPALWFDGEGTIYHFNGLSAAATWGNLAIILRTSNDSGITWSRARLIVAEHGYRQMVGEPVFRAHDGAIIFGADAVYGSTIWISRDNGLTWSDPGGTLNGIHAGIVELSDGRLMALGRGMDVAGKMPMSISQDMGKTWQVSASCFEPISSGQRLALIRLKEGALFVASFTNGMTVTDISGRRREVAGLFGALSYDQGRSWPVRRLITDDGPGRKLDGGAWTDEFVMSASGAEPKGYMSVCESADGLIHLISSAQHYAFNVKWLQSRPPAIPAE